MEADGVKTKHLDTNGTPGKADMEADSVTGQCSEKPREAWKRLHSQVNTLGMTHKSQTRSQTKHQIVRKYKQCALPAPLALAICA